MGRIRTKDIKMTSHEMIKRKPDAFSKDFETTKKDVNALGLKISKRARNKLAGYITRRKKIQTK